MRLLPWPRPLEERLGRAFFLGLPRGPGVYLMWDESGRLIYVGKAVNLRQRLSSYRYLEGASRKTRRLVHTVRRITFEECPDAEAAVVRENELLRRHRPPFNRLNTWPQANCYLELTAGKGWIGLAVTRPEDTHAQASRKLTEQELPGLFGEVVDCTGEVAHWRQTFGAFRPGAIAAFHCLAGILGLALGPILPECAAGRDLETARRRRQFRLSCAEPELWFDQLAVFLDGESDALLGRIEAGLPEPTSPFEGARRTDWIERLRHFHRIGPARNRHLRRTFGIAPRRLEREELDDLLARDRERRLR
jgi:predicted GIY-YIG superfamily endonuclease